MKKQVLVATIVTLAVILAGGVWAPAGAALNHYHYQDLGTLGGSSWASAISDSGAVTGSYVGPGGFDRPFRWTKKTGMQDLGVDVPNSHIDTRGINKKGLIVGVVLGSVDNRAFLWSQKLGLQYIPTLGGNENYAEAINSKGQVTGSSVTSEGYTHPFIWTQKKGMEADLGVPGEDSVAYSINSRGQVVGFRVVGGHGLACLWNSPTDRVDIPPLPGHTESLARGVNDLGQVAGYSVGAGGYRAFLWNPNGVTTDLGAIGGDFVQSYAWGINKLGHVVGGSYYADWSVEHAFLWTPDGGMRDLNDPSLVLDLPPGVTLIYAQAINKSRQIVGQAKVDGAYHAFLLTPVK